MLELALAESSTSQVFPHSVVGLYTDTCVSLLLELSCFDWHIISYHHTISAGTNVSVHKKTVSLIKLLFTGVSVVTKTQSYKQVEIPALL